jgi:hypothetical protein
MDILLITLIAMLIIMTLIIAISVNTLIKLHNLLKNIEDGKL